MKYMAIDIETSPNLAHVWGIWDQNVGLNQLEKTTEVICFAAKFFGERKVHFSSVHGVGKQQMLADAHALLEAADVVVHYNGKRFDIPHLNREFVEAGLKPPAPYSQIDLYQVAKRRFRFQSNKLEHVAKTLGLAGKVKHEGFELWRKCLAGDDAAWKRMERYNKQDVALVEQVYGLLQPWIPSHPNRNLYEGTDNCPTCGSDELQRRGFSRTSVSTFQRWQCQSCGSWFRSGKRVAGSDLRPAAIN